MDIPLCELDHTPQIFLDDPDDLPLYRQAPERFAGAIAPDSAACAEWARSLDPLPVGLVLECPPVPDEDECERPVTMDYIRRCKRAFRPLLHDDAAFYYLRGAQTFASLRAAVLALGDITGRTVIAEIAIEDDEGRMADGTVWRAGGRRTAVPSQ